MAALPGAVKHPPLIRSGEEGIRSRDALDVPLVSRSGRQKGCVKHIQENMARHSFPAVFFFFF